MPGTLGAAVYLLMALGGACSPALHRLPAEVDAAAFLGSHTGWNSYIPFITFPPAGGGRTKLES